MSDPLRLPKLWLAWNAVVVSSGWLLSLAGALNHASWLILGIAGLALSGWTFWHNPIRWPKPAALKRRWKRWPALGFLLLVVAGAVGGLLYEPNNIDALAYRTPRVLHWIAEGRWHWIPAPYQRLNTRACGFEWTTVPLLTLFKSDRPLFLLSLTSFCLLPGLVFSSLRQAGVSGRASAVWMWLFPTGYCFALQAGSIGNDLYGATLSTSALCLALVARRKADPASAAWSLVAAGLMTGAKSSNLPLLLPWLFLIWPAAGPWIRRPALATASILVGLACSLAPISGLNLRHTGDWTGLRAEDAWIRPPGPVACAIHNLGLLATQNLLPPILPGAGKLNAAVERALPESWKTLVDGFAENGRAAYAVRELPGEEHAGLGFGISWLALGTLVWGIRQRLAGHPGAKPQVPAWLLLLPWIALGPYLVKSGITTAGRILAPYYPWLLPGLLIFGAADTAIRTRWFRTGAALATALTLVLVVLLPTRPLWPAQTILTALRQRSGSQALDRASTVYEVYARRADVFAPLKQWIPVDSPWIGFVTVNDAETSLWKPIGSHRVRHLLATDRIDGLRAQGLRCVVASTEDFAVRFRQPLEEWARANGGRIAGRTSIRLLAREPAREYVVVVW